MTAPNAETRAEITDIAAVMADMGARARKAAARLAALDAQTRANAISAVAAHVRAASQSVLAANARDIAGLGEGVTPAFRDRLTLTPERLEAIAQGADAVAALRDPVGVELARWEAPSGLDIARVSTPIGVIAVIFESRPNVAVDAAAICLKSANAVILRGGSEAARTCEALIAAARAGLAEAGVAPDAVQYVPTTDRAAVGALLSGLDGAIDLVIPRGGKGLVARVQADARAPVLAHLDGLNHTYVHAAADPARARAIVLNAKMRRPGVCGATETLLIDAACAPTLLPAIAEDLAAAQCRLKGDARARDIVPAMEPASDADFATEHLDAILNVAVVDGLDAALAHIARFGSHHTDAIVTKDDAAAERFLAEVDSAIVLRDASTQFADGGEFGFGAEIGIATGRLHARGPVGPAQLTTFKYLVRGAGQTRP